MTVNVKNQTNQSSKLLVERSRALGVLLKSIHPDQTNYSLKTMFFAFIPTSAYCSLPETQRHNIAFTYNLLTDFLSKSTINNEDALEILNQVDLTEVGKVVQYMFSTFVTTEDYCRSMEIERKVLISEINAVMDFLRAA